MTQEEKKYNFSGVRLVVENLHKLLHSRRLQFLPRLS
jgi:hypothetical protein